MFFSFIKNNNKKLEETKERKKEENQLSLTPINEISTFLHLKAALRHNKQEKKKLQAFPMLIFLDTANKEIRGVGD